VRARAKENEHNGTRSRARFTGNDPTKVTTPLYISNRSASRLLRANRTYVHVFMRSARTQNEQYIRIVRVVHRVVNRPVFSRSSRYFASIGFKSRYFYLITSFDITILIFYGFCEIGYQILLSINRVILMISNVYCQLWHFYKYLVRLVCTLYLTCRYCMWICNG
jgi:hypothetical protein